MLSLDELSNEVLVSPKTEVLESIAYVAPRMELLGALLELPVLFLSITIFVPHGHNQCGAPIAADLEHWLPT